MYTIRDLIDRYSVTEATVLGWIHRGELKAINVGRAPEKKKPRWRITQAALDEFERMRATVSQPAPARPTRRKQSAEVIEFF